MNRHRKRLSLPTRWNLNETRRLIKLEGEIRSPDVVIGSLYGALNHQPIGHGRNRRVVLEGNRDREDAVEFVRELQRLGKKFTYLVNGPFGGEFNEEIRDYLEWIANVLRPDSVSIRSLEPMIWFLNNSDSNVIVSSIVNVQTREEFLRLIKELEKGKRQISGIVLGQDAVRHFEELEAISKIAASLGIKLEALVNETCLFGCPRKAEHYDVFGTPNTDVWPDEFQTWCNRRKMIHPDEILKAGGMIPPQLLDFYAKEGLYQFKIAGRELTPEATALTAEAYLRERYEGNVIDLTAITPPQITGTNGRGASDFFFLDCNSLAETIGNLSDLPSEKRDGYIRERAIELYRECKLRVGENSYEVKNGRLTLVGG